MEEKCDRSEIQIFPDHPGTAGGGGAVAEIVEHTLDEIARSLGCVRLMALSYAPRERVLRSMAATGGAGLDRNLTRLTFPVSEFPAADRALRTGLPLPLPNPTGFPEPLVKAFEHEVVLLPILSRGRPLALLIGQTGGGVAARSAAWESRAREIADRALLVVELERVACAYQEELHLVQSTRMTTAAILEGRSLHDIAEMIMDMVTFHLQEERVAMFTLEPDGRFRPIAMRHLSSAFGEAIFRTTRASAPLAARAKATGLPYYARNVQEDNHFTPEQHALFAQEGIRHVLVATLQYEDRILGTLAVYPRGERQFTPGELAAFRSLADKVTLGIATSRHLEQLREIAMVEERNRLAREIHDTVAQSLAGLMLQIETTQSSLAANDLEAAREMLASARTLAKKTLEETRRAVQGMGPAALERLSLAQAIAEEAGRFESETGTSAQFLLSGEEQPLDREQRMSLLRITQESLANVRKHAHATRVRIGLQGGAQEVVLLVEDDGAGFDPEDRPAPGPEGGYGLFGMTERARLAGGDLRIESTPGWGTRIRVSMPYHAPHADLNSAARSDASQTPPPTFRPQPVPDREPALPTSSAPIRALLADDHLLVRQGVRAMLEASGAVIVVGEAGDGEEAVRAARELKPDVVLMDLQMPRVNGIEAARRIHAETPDLPVVILTTHQTDEWVKAALSVGVRGFLLKDAQPTDLIASIRAAHRGETLLSPAVTERLSALAVGKPTGAVGANTLNAREREVLTLLARGARNKEIAAKLFITTSTVEYHLSNIYNKLGVSNRTEAVRAAIELGIIGK